ncbi:MAG: SpoIIE family protein phosphatase [Crocinitomicaceae bacterium]|nr:SpoIIE family protein phosphatase [Crocinitomicaceae bacterium]
MSGAARVQKKVLILLLVVLVGVITSAYFVYTSLSEIVTDLTEEARPDESLLQMKEMLYHLSDAENNIKSYALTQDVNYLNAYYENYTEANASIDSLRNLTVSEKNPAHDIDTLDSLVSKKFDMLDNLLLLQGESRVMTALEKISLEIEPENNSSNGQNNENTELQEREEKNFFDRLLNKRKKNKKNEDENSSTAPEDNTLFAEKITVDELNAEIETIQLEEERIDKKLKAKELELIQADKAVMDEIRKIISTMEEREKLNMDEKLALADDTSFKTKIMIGFFCLLTCALLAIAVVIVNKYIVRNEAFKIALKRAKHETDLKNKEITDSITYAKKIQEALLPDEQKLSENLNDYFVFYEPKDIVAGDFYWIEKSANKTFIAVADCTGHGVPGAMVSVVCSTALNRCVREFELQTPAEILDKCRNMVIDALASGNQLVKDGMDIALIAIEHASHSSNEINVEYAGANNPLYMIIENNLQELRADKQPVGLYQHQTPFTNHKITLKKGTMLYLFSDGYADQFGGPQGKKFKYRPFQEMLKKNSGLETEKQLHFIRDNFMSWRGSFEQIDDVCVVGIKV